MSRRTSKAFSLKTAMESISKIECCTKPFQFFALQCFSLKSLHKDEVGKRRKIYLTVVSIVISVSQGYHTYKVLEQNLNSHEISHNSFRAALYVYHVLNYVVLFYSSLILTFCRNSRLRQFFRNSEKILHLCWSEFNFKANFTRVKVVVFMFMTVQACYMFAWTFYELFNYDDDVKALHEAFLVLLSMLAQTFVHFVAIKYAFYVILVNFHLALLKSILLKHFPPLIPAQLKCEVVFNISKSTMNTKRKIIALQKIYCLTKQMACIVNATMGFTVLQLVLIFIIDLIMTGYDFITHFHTNTFDGIGSKNLKFIYIFHLNLTYLFTSQWTSFCL